MRVATWNVENLFLPGEDDGRPTPAAYAEKLALLADTIGALDADVVALQEIGEPEALDALVARLAGTWSSVVSSAPDDRGIRVAFIARVPLRDPRGVVAFVDDLDAVQVDDTGMTTATMGRGALLVTATISGRDVELLTCHLKSKLLTFGHGRFSPRDEDERARFGAYALFRRAAEAATVRAAATAVLDGRGTERDVIVLGDLNDEEQAATTQILLGPPGSEIGTGGFDVPDRGDPQRLFNLAPLIPADRRYSRVYRGRRELIDHILVSRALAGRVVSVATGRADLPSIDDDPRGAPPRASDHAPVVAEFAPA